jgi:1,4-dihydroxy-2-naphthoate octaprenyltransferase
VIIGASASRAEYVGLLALAYAVPVGLFFFAGFGPLVLLPLASIPYAVVVARRVLSARTHEELIPMTPQAGQVLMAHAALFVAGLLCS